MTIHDRLKALIDAAATIGIAVEKVPLGGEGGGLAILAGRRRLFVDTMADDTTAYETTLAALATIPEINSLHLPAPVRDDIEKSRRD
ncbi:MAG TPA: hypothetical protein P5081_13370 [Phycisphaerae bacterium]|nr:hypothetical protein [Phycisphaerae bacterium]HRW53866.1 hypothetical protein [Phycisphaerae bacterium]